MRKLSFRGELARDLSYCLFNIAEKKGRFQEAQGYNAIVLGWPEVTRLARGSGSQKAKPISISLFDQLEE